MAAQLFTRRIKTVTTTLAFIIAKDGRVIASIGDGAVAAPS